MGKLLLLKDSIFVRQNSILQSLIGYFLDVYKMQITKDDRYLFLMSDRNIYQLDLDNNSISGHTSFKYNLNDMILFNDTLIIALNNG